jgi:tRNA pseudouridine38-40 synthase
MVRVIAGTLFDVAYGRLSIDHVADALRTGDRARAGQTAPAHGLCLEEVFYPDFPWAQPRWSLPPRP